MFWYLQWDFLSLIREYSGGKLKQKGFFHSVMCLGFKMVGFYLTLSLYFACLICCKGNLLERTKSKYVFYIYGSINISPRVVSVIVPTSTICNACSPCSILLQHICTILFLTFHGILLFYITKESEKSYLIVFF